MYPGIFNLPLFNQLMGGMGGMQGGNTFTPSGKPVTGPFQNNTNIPFRTVEGIGQYGNGLNSSASQIYTHFSGGQNAMGRKYRDHGLRAINPKTQIQSDEDFLNRGSLFDAGGQLGNDLSTIWGNLTGGQRTLPKQPIAQTQNAQTQAQNPFAASAQFGADLRSIYNNMMGQESAPQNAPAPQSPPIAMNLPPSIFNLSPEDMASMRGRGII